MRIKRQPMRLVAAAAAIALVAAACGNEDNSVESLTELDFSGLDVNVGSKNFVEQFVLGELAIVALEAGGANVTDSTNLGGTVVNRDALLGGEIDAYWEYNGTGWTVHLAQEDPSFDAVQLTNDVCTMDLEENDIRWIGVSPFNDTYGFATASDSPAAGVDLAGMMDYVNENPDATVCMETEFPNRPDGLVLLEDATGLTVPESQVEILDTGVIYDETASGNCTFGEVFTTDGRIPALDLDLVEDPGVFILYNVSLTMPDDVYQQAPEAFEALADTVLAGLDEETMAELNRRVSADGEDPRAVAEDYLTQQGLL
jgi:osmoprotectant transport system substrate-binding protein